MTLDRMTRKRAGYNGSHKCLKLTSTAGCASHDVMVMTMMDRKAIPKGIPEMMKPQDGLDALALNALVLPNKCGSSKLRTRNGSVQSSCSSFRNLLFSTLYSASQTFLRVISLARQQPQLHVPNPDVPTQDTVDGEFGTILDEHGQAALDYATISMELSMVFIKHAAIEN